MRIETQEVVWGLEQEALVWNKQEVAALKRAEQILSKARDLIGPDTEFGTELGKAEGILYEYGDSDLILGHSRVEITL